MSLAGILPARQVPGTPGLGIRPAVAEFDWLRRPPSRVATPFVQQWRIPMKSVVWPMLSAAVLVVLASAPCRGASYAQISSSETQLGTPAPKRVALNSDDALGGISNANGVVAFKDAGTYFVMAAAQVGSNKPEGQGKVRLWMRQNGQDVANSNTEQAITPGFTAVLVCQGVAEVKAGDTLELRVLREQGRGRTRPDRNQAGGRTGRAQRDLLGLQGRRVGVCPALEQRIANRRRRSQADLAQFDRRGQRRRKRPGRRARQAGRRLFRHGGRPGRH